MKRVMLFFIVISLIMIAASCSQETTTQKTEEELKAEIKAEMEAEAKKREELEAKIREELEAQMKAEAEEAEKEKDSAVTESQSSQEAIELSALMTKDEIIAKLGDDYTLIAHEDGGYFMYDTELAYEGISFSFYHDKKEIPANKYPDGISITSNKYRFNYDFNIGDSALKAIEYCESNFENAYDRHNDRYIFDVFNYKEKNNDGKLVDTKRVISWEYDTNESYSNINELSKDVKINTVYIFGVLD